MDTEQSCAVDPPSSQDPASSSKDRRSSVQRLAASLRHSVRKAGAGLEAEALCTVMAVLLGRHLRFDSADTYWPDRDRVVLAADLAGLGKAAAALLGSGEGLFCLPGQPLGVATGLALADRMLAGRFGRSLVDHRSWVLGSEAELATGAVQEAARLAGGWRLGRLTVIVAVRRRNAPGLAGFAANDWSLRHTLADDVAGIESAFSAAARAFKPTLIACLGEPGELPGAEPDDSALDWAAAGRRSASARRAWLKRLARHAGRQDFEHAMQGRLAGHSNMPDSAKYNCTPGPGPASTTAQAVQHALTQLSAEHPSLAAMPGDASWPAPNIQPEPACARDVSGQLTQAGSAATAGMALHGGFVPFAAHRLSSFPGVQPALAEAASRRLRLLQVLIEPATPCPVTCQRSSLRAMRNVTVMRPASVSEALECLDIALRQGCGPSVLLLSEDPAPSLDEQQRAHVARGGYVVAEAVNIRQATLVASGAELHVAMDARARLAALGVHVAVVSLLSWDLFSAQKESWIDEVLGQAPRIGIEQGSGFGWERWLGETGLFIALSSGHDTSALADTVCRHLESLRPTGHLPPLSTEHLRLRSHRPPQAKNFGGCTS